MSLLKYVIIGAAAVCGIKYATKKRENDGKSLIDDLTNQSPDYLAKAKKFGKTIKQDVTQTTGLY